MRTGHGKKVSPPSEGQRGFERKHSLLEPTGSMVRPKTISRNAHYIVLLKNPRDQTGIRTLSQQIYPMTWHDALEVYNKATVWLAY